VSHTLSVILVIEVGVIAAAALGAILGRLGR
jgi:hypothetical protein